MAASCARVDADRAERPRRAGQRGYAAVLVAAVLAMASLAAVLDRLDTAQYRLQRESDTAAALQAAKLALIGHAASFRDFHPTENFGYLPCPDTAGSGVEQTPCGKAGKVAIGLLPYKTLGLGDLRDAEGNCLWYAVSGSFKSSPKSWPFNWDSRGQITVRDAAGALLAEPDDSHGGAAAVVIAPGPPVAGQRRDAANGCGAALAGIDAFLENSGDVFVHGTIVDAAGRTTSNDRLAWVTSKEIFDAIVRRNDFAEFIASGIAAMRPRLGSQRATAGDALPSTNPFGRQAVAYSFYEGWRDQFRYLRCAKSGCYVDTKGGRHDALLLFGGRRADGTPRPAAARTPQDYFESALALAQGRIIDICSAEAAVFDNSSSAGRDADLALCLAP